MLSPITSVLGCFTEHKTSASQGVAAQVLVHRGHSRVVANSFSLSWETLSSKNGLQNSDLWTVSADIRGKGVILRGET